MPLNEETQEEAQDWLDMKWKIEEGFVKILGNLEKKTIDNLPNEIFWVDQNDYIIIAYYRALGYMRVDYDIIYANLTIGYGLDSDSFSDILKGIISEHMGINVPTPIGLHRSDTFSKLLKYNTDTMNEETQEEAKEYLEKKWKIEDWFIGMIENLEIKSDLFNTYYFHKDTKELYLEHISDNNRLFVSAEYVFDMVDSKLISWGLKRITSQETTKLLSQLVDEHLNIPYVKILDVDFQGEKFIDGKLVKREKPTQEGRVIRNINELYETPEETQEFLKERWKVEDWFVKEVLPNLDKTEVYESEDHRGDTLWDLGDGMGINPPTIVYFDKNTKQPIFIYYGGGELLYGDGDKIFTKIYSDFNITYHSNEMYEIIKHLAREYLNIVKIRRVAPDVMTRDRIVDGKLVINAVPQDSLLKNINEDTQEEIKEYLENKWKIEEWLIKEILPDLKKVYGDGDGSGVRLYWIDNRDLIMISYNTESSFISIDVKLNNQIPKIIGKSKGYESPDKDHSGFDWDGVIGARPGQGEWLTMLYKDILPEILNIDKIENVEIVLMGYYYGKHINESTEQKQPLKEEEFSPNSPQQVKEYLENKWKIEEWLIKEILPDLKKVYGDGYKVKKIYWIDNRDWIMISYNTESSFISIDVTLNDQIPKIIGKSKGYESPNAKTSGAEWGHWEGGQPRPGQGEWLTMLYKDILPEILNINKIEYVEIVPMGYYYGKHINESTEQNQINLQTIMDDQGMLVNIIFDDHKIGHIALETRDYKTYTIIDSLVDEKYRTKGYYKKSLFELIRQKPNITIISVFRSSESQNAWDSLMDNLPNDIDIKKTQEEGNDLYWLSYKKGTLNESWGQLGDYDQDYFEKKWKFENEFEKQSENLEEKSIAGMDFARFWNDNNNITQILYEPQSYGLIMNLDFINTIRFEIGLGDSLTNDVVKQILKDIVPHYLYNIPRVEYVGILAMDWSKFHFNEESINYKDVIKEETKEEAMKSLEQRWKFEDWFNKYMEGLTKKTLSDFPENILWVDKNLEVKLRYHKQRDIFHVDKGLVGGIMRTQDTSSGHARTLIREYLKEHLNLDVPIGFQTCGMNLDNLRAGLWIIKNLLMKKQKKKQ